MNIHDIHKTKQQTNKSPNSRMLNLSTLIIVSLLFGGAQSQDDWPNFQCRNLDVGQYYIDIHENFDYVSPGLAVENCKDKKIILPEIIHWHVFSIPVGELPRIATIPEGLVRPIVASNTLEFHIQEDAMDGFAQGDTIEAGVVIFLPPDKMKKVLIDGSDEIIEISNTLTSSTELESIVIDCSGTDNMVYVSSPNARVKFQGSGVDNTVTVEAASGSSLAISGADHHIQIKTGEDLDVELSGVDQELTIEGDYNHVELSGSDSKVYVNGPTRCDVIENSGCANSCSVTEETVRVAELPCLASSKVIQAMKPCLYARWYTGGSGLGIWFLVILLMCLSCLACERCCGKRYARQGSAAVHPHTEPNKNDGNNMEQPKAAGAPEGGATQKEEFNLPLYWSNNIVLDP